VEVVDKNQLTRRERVLEVLGPVRGKRILDWDVEPVSSPESLSTKTRFMELTFFPNLSNVPKRRA